MLSSSIVALLFAASLGLAAVPDLDGPRYCVRPRTGYPQKTRNCNAQGTLNDPAPLGSAIPVHGAHECSQRCFGGDNPTCKSFSYTPQTPHTERIQGTCQLYSRLLNGMGFRRSGNDTRKDATVYSAQKCFSIEKVMYPSILKDGDFDNPSSASAWQSDVVGNGAVDISYSHSGVHEAEFVDNSAGGGGDSIFQFVDTCTHTVYQVRWYQSGSSKGQSSQFAGGVERFFPIITHDLSAEPEEKAFYFTDHGYGSAPIRFVGSFFGTEDPEDRTKQFLSEVQVLPVYWSLVPPHAKIIFTT